MEAVAAAPRRSPGRVALILLGTIFSLGAVAIGALALLDLAARHSFRTTSAYTNVRSLVVSSSAGDVSLTPAPAGARLTVTEDETEALFKPRVRAQLANGALTLKASCPGHLECSVDYVLSVPPDVAIRVSSGFGHIAATNLASGSSIQLATSAGGIDATGLSAPNIKLSTGLGGLHASLVQPARSLTASTFAGSLRLTVPDVTYALHVGSGAGQVSDRALRADPASPRSIDAHSSLGDIAIKLGP